MDTEEKIHKIEVAVVKIGSDVSHLKDRVENGISSTVTEISKKLTELVIPKVNDNCYWIEKIKVLIFSLAGLGVTGFVITTIIWFSKFYKGG